jgi:ubiquinone/menaquinone biosynthesis C-methylase UbiE
VCRESSGRGAPPGVARSVPMGTIQARYDATAERYRTWWEPVLAPTAARLLDRFLPEAADGAVPRILDIGTGAGVLSLAAIRRWPTARIVGLDASTGMLAVAAAAAEADLDEAERGRLELVAGDAGRLPFSDGTFDLALASFVLQLVSDRFAALREARRVLRPGGRFASVTWLAGRADDRFAPDAAFEKALDELDIGGEDEVEEARSGDFPSTRAAAAQLRRAGFREVRAVEVTLVHRYDRTTYVEFLEQYAEREVFEDLEPAMRRRLRQRTAVRLARLPRDAFEWRVPVVEASGVRP